MTASGRYASPDSSFGRSTGNAAARGGALIAIAVLIGFLLLWKGGVGGSDSAVEAGPIDDGTSESTDDQGGDAAALAYQAMEKASAQGTDVLIIDTAGRLQNRSELMDELAKIVRVIRKLDDSAPHDSVIVLDGTVGQNAISQVSAFKEVADVSGLIVTKLDGSAKGGVVITLADTFGLPVHAVGVGEGADDLQPFEARDFANALAGVPDTSA